MLWPDPFSARNAGMNFVREEKLSRAVLFAEIVALWVAGHRRICPHNPNLFLLFNPAFTPLPLTFAIIVRLLLYIKPLQQRYCGGSSNHFSLSRQARLYPELVRRPVGRGCEGKGEPGGGVWT